MTRIWSGRQIDQVYAGMAERLVRQSNNARLDPNVGVNPRVRRILARMHRAGLLENMAGLWLPDMYTADGDNRVERMGGLTAQGALEQGSAGSRPTLTRDDERSNFALQSIFPGAMESASPTGWATSNHGTGAPDGEIVESVDDTSGHQAWECETTKSSHRRNLTQSIPRLDGQNYVVAAKVEALEIVSGDSTLFFVGSVSTFVQNRRLGIDPMVVGDWAYWAFEQTAATDAFRIGISGSGMVGSVRVSRPMVAYMPPDFPSWTEPQRQQWITDHYAATSSLSEYAGTPDGLRASHIGVGQSLEGPTFNLGDHSEFSFFALMNCHRDGVVEGYQRLSDGNGTGFIGQANGDVRARVVMSGSDHDLDAAPSGGRRNQWLLYGMSAVVGGQFLYSQNGTGVDSTTLPDTAFDDDAFPLAMSEGDANYTLEAAFLSLGQAFDASEHATLHEILTETP